MTDSRTSFEERTNALAKRIDKALKSDFSLKYEDNKKINRRIVSRIRELKKFYEGKNPLSEIQQVDCVTTNPQISEKYLCEEEKTLLFILLAEEKFFVEELQKKFGEKKKPSSRRLLSLFS